MKVWAACRDYRWEQYPARHHVVKHPQDNSLMTYRGHQVLTTLIRAYFSPLHTTAQRFIYAGSADGSVYIYGKAVECCCYCSDACCRLCTGTQDSGAPPVGDVCMFAPVACAMHEGNRLLCCSAA